MNKNHIIFWDIDGTLMHCGSDGKKALNRTFSELYGIADAFSSAPIGGSLDAVLIRAIMQSFGIPKDELKNIHDHYHRTLKKVLAEDNDKQILPGVIPALKALDVQPLHRSALLTSNLKIGAYAKLESVGLHEYFDFGGFGDEPVEKWDVAEQCIAQAQEKYGTIFSREQIFLIGDSDYDITSARKIGIQSIAVATGWVSADRLLENKPDHFFYDLSETQRVLKVLGL